MQASTARDHLFERAKDIDDDQFEQLCKMVLERAEPTRELELTPFRQDGGIDIQAIIDRDLFLARLGVQVKQYARGNNIGLPDIQRFKGALFDIDYQIGAYITLSDYTSSAVESADQSYIRLVNGDELMKLMLTSEIGIEQVDENEFEEDLGFWEAFEEPEREGIIPTDEVPQADRVELMPLALIAIDKGFDVKPQISKYLETHAAKFLDDEDLDSYDPRQGDYYPMAAWTLELVHRNFETEYQDRTVRQWRLTRRGEEYLELFRIGDKEGARTLMCEAIRGVEIVQRITARIREETTITHSEMKEIIDEESAISGETVKRRATTLGNWIDYLPEYTKHKHSGQTPQRYEYVGEGLSDYR